VPLEAHIKKNPAYFHRFDVNWTPTVLVLDANGKERFRIDGYLPKDEFRVHLEMGLARIAFMSKKWADAEERYAAIAEREDTKVAPEAIYWRAVSHYKATNDHTVLNEVPVEIGSKYPESVWALKAIPWADE
jgi:hypothetical protein